MLTIKKLNAWWARRDSNPQGLLHAILSRARIPIPPLAHSDLANRYYILT